MLNYVKIPKEIIYDKSMDVKRALVFSYLCCRRALDDTIAFSIEELCLWSYMKPNRQEGKINQKYLELLNQISQKQYFIEYPDFSTLSCADISKYYCMSANIDKFDKQKTFGMIYFFELQKILNFKEELKDTDIKLERITSGHILLLLSYLRLNMNRSEKKPLCCYRLYEKISNDIGISERYIGRIVEILDILKIIKTKEAMRIRYKDKTGRLCFQTAPKVFADYEKYDTNGEYISKYDCDEEIANQIGLLNKQRKEK